MAQTEGGRETPQITYHNRSYATLNQNITPTKISISLTEIFNYNQKNQLKICTLEVRHAFELQTSN